MAMARGETALRLSKGLRGPDGKCHRAARLRPARVRDEIRALEDFRVHLRPELFPLVLLSRVITRLGLLRKVDPGSLQALDPQDLDLLCDAYLRSNAYPEDSPR
ncbi:MAG: hypothetical protein JXA90_12550 [Planctomycetes bacterium]|nr:hypothetical protein [Planctomycetota bacterium]